MADDSQKLLETFNTDPKNTPVRRASTMYNHTCKLPQSCKNIADFPTTGLAQNLLFLSYYPGAQIQIFWCWQFCSVKDRTRKSMEQEWPKAVHWGLPAALSWMVNHDTWSLAAEGNDVFSCHELWEMHGIFLSISNQFLNLLYPKIPVR